LYDEFTLLAEHYMATLKLNKLTSAQRQELAAQLAAYEKKDLELARLVGAFRSTLEEAGFTAADAVALLSPAKTRGPAKKSTPGVDKTGGKPTPGTTYKHPTTGETWTKAANGKGAPKKEFVALVAAGSTWAELRTGSDSPRKANAKTGAKKTSR
jgi:hypothetical protein